MMKIMLAFVGSIYYTVDFSFCLNIVDFGSDWCLLTFFWSTIAGFMWMKQILKSTTHSVDAQNSWHSNRTEINCN